MSKLSDTKPNGRTIDVRLPTLRDGARIHEFIRSCGTLELNSPYSYFLLCSHFAETGAVAVESGQVVGFLGGYLIPQRPDTYFIWQVGVAAETRGTGLAGRLIESVLQRPFCANVRYIEATVSPENPASAAVFRKLAERLETDHKITPFLEKGDFLHLEHDAEHLHRVGPFTLTPDNKGAGS